MERYNTVYDYPPFYTAPTPRFGTPEPDHAGAAVAYPSPEASPRRAPHAKLPQSSQAETQPGHGYTSNNNTTMHEHTGLHTGHTQTGADAVLAAAALRLRALAGTTPPCTSCGAPAAGQCYVTCYRTGEINRSGAHASASGIFDADDSYWPSAHARETRTLGADSGAQPGAKLAAGSWYARK